MENRKILIDANLLYHTCAWMGRLIASGSHQNTLCPEHAVNTLEMLQDSYDNPLNTLESIKMAICNEVKQELTDDALINEENDPLVREYLKGCNGGVADALYRIMEYAHSDDTRKTYE